MTTLETLARNTVRTRATLIPLLSQRDFVILCLGVMREEYEGAWKEEVVTRYLTDLRAEFSE